MLSMTLKPGEGVRVGEAIISVSHSRFGVQLSVLLEGAQETFIGAAAIGPDVSIVARDQRGRVRMIVDAPRHIPVERLKPNN